MARDWVSDRTTDLTDPFLLRRDGFEVIEADITAGGGGGGSGRTVTFSQAAGAPAVTGGSPKYIATAAGTIDQCLLAVASAPVGGPLTVEFLLNDAVFATLQIAADDTTTATTGTDLGIAVGNADEITVNSTEVGATTPAQGITAMVVIN